MNDLLRQTAPLAAPVAYFAAELALVTVFSRLQNDLVMRHLGRRVYMLLMWPGVCVHELSHALGCLLTRTRIVEVNLFGPRQQGRLLVLGYVAHEEARHDWQQVLIGVAPFFGGTAVLYALVWVAFPGAASLLGSMASLNLDLTQYWRWISDFAQQLGGASFGWWQALVAYLLFSVAAHLAPSSKDLAGAGLPLLLVALGISLPLALLGLLWPPGFLWSMGVIGRLATAVIGLMAVALVGVTAGLIASATASALVVTLKQRGRP
jgi:hypothetical protein